MYVDPLKFTSTCPVSDYLLCGNYQTLDMIVSLV